MRLIRPLNVARLLALLLAFSVFAPSSSLEGATRRAIDFRQDEAIDEAAFKALIREAVALNLSKR